ncbi:hydroxyacid dehydrogenase [Desulfofundulus thermosubterraneus]|uniref:2-oxoglutarate reductase n=1 Tax=Desulfofundulus thermosubterraneus DSM 16057 TaxID=1121432 RepID=A0A1M6CW12_9FIRM|nr:hydroxyacid dehydrogenase [Desulfofundulus thermosubterraneus]SHI65197.1 (S)-sulfolactate dehydrogenase [Desulfofundulus thermosubterraneus DSM 16057]
MKIVVSELIWEEGLQILSELGNVVYDANLWKQDLARELVDADALVVRNQTRVTRELIQAAPRLKVIGRLGVGLDNIDLAAAREAGIPVVYARNANAISVAEYVFAAMLTFARRLEEATAHVKGGGWNRRLYTRMELYGKTLGLIGTGEIGTRLAYRAQAFGMKILGYDPFVPPYEVACTEFGVQLTDLKTVLSQADFVSLHVPLNNATRNLINRETLSLMKPSAYLINTARGGVVNEEDLYNVLREGKIGGAALDVLAQEPPQDSPLFKLDNVILTPHIAGLTEEAQVKTSVLVAQEVVKILRGEPSSCVVR